MPNKHQILVGPYRSGKSFLLIEKVVKHCLENRNIEDFSNGIKNKSTILVPSNRYRKLVEKRIAKMVSQLNGETAASGIAGLEILTIHQFCQEALFTAGIFVKSLPDSTRMPLLLYICKQLMTAGQIKQLAPILHFAGTQKSILSLIDEWQRANYRAADIIKKTKEAPEQNKELAKIYLAYEQALGKINCFDSHTLIFKMTEFLNTQKQIDRLSNYIVFDGFDRFNAMQLELGKALAKHTEQMYISFDYQQPQDNLFEEYAWKERSYEQINAHLGDSFAIKEINVGDNASEHSAAMTNTSTSANLSNQIDCFASGDRLAEMSIIAARIKSLIVAGKAKPNEIVVTARSMTPYKAAADAAFKDAGLEYYIDEPIGLQALPLTHFLLSLLSVAADDFKRQAVIDCLRSPYLRLAAIGINDKDVEIINEISLNKKVVAGESQWQQALKSELRFSKNLSHFFQELKMPAAITNAVGYVTWVEDLIDKFLDLANIEEDTESLEGWKQKEALAQCRKQLASLIQEETIIGLLAGQAENKRETKKTMTASGYYEQLKSGIEATNFTTSGQNANQVLIASAELIPNQKYKQIFLAGMVEGEFPAVKNSSGFLSTREIEQWRKLGIYIYNPRMEAGFEYALFASLINRAQEKITLSYPTMEMSSSKDELLPSFFFNALQIEPSSINFIAFENSESAYNSPRNMLACLLWQGQNINEINRQYNMPVIRSFIDQAQDKFSFAAMRSKQLRDSPLNGYLVDHVAASTVKVNLPEYWSASQLSDYGKCPFAYWLNQTLKIKPPEEPEAILNARDRGIFYHKTLELYYQKVIDNNIVINFAQQNKLKELFDQSIQEGLNWLEEQGWFRASEFWAQEKNTLVFRLHNFYMAEYNRFMAEGGQFKPYMVEAVFGPDTEYGPLVLSAHDKTIKLRGKIDRIDIETSGAGQNKKLRIIDYKSGSTPINATDVESGRDLQLPLYALAAQKCIVSESKVNNYRYLAISSGKALSAKRDDQIEIQNDIRTLEERIFEFVENIEKGDFSVRPSKKEVCNNCPHSTVCRVKEFRITETVE